jgi:hypothetical protein
VIWQPAGTSPFQLAAEQRHCADHLHLNPNREIVVTVNDEVRGTFNGYLDNRGGFDLVVKVVV